ncbi:DUF4232 domain-containing protein [Micromonosporaceae bacterium Da 78-11]
MRIRIGTRPLLFVLAALMAGACVPEFSSRKQQSSTVQLPPATPARAASPVPTDRAPACAGGLSVRPGRLDVGAGLHLLEVELVNCGRTTVKIKGSPLVRVLDADQKPFDVTVGHGDTSPMLPEQYRLPARSVTLKPGQHATTLLAWRMVVREWSSAVQGTYLEIIPADGFPAQLVTRYSPYNLGDTGALAAGAWIRSGA